METMLTKRTSRAEAGLIVVCLLCEDLFAGLWGIFLFHGAKVIILLEINKQFSIKKVKSTIHSYINHVSFLIPNTYIMYRACIA